MYSFGLNSSFAFSSQVQPSANNHIPSEAPHSPSCIRMPKRPGIGQFPRLRVLIPKFGQHKNTNIESDLTLYREDRQTERHIASYSPLQMKRVPSGICGDVGICLSARLSDCQAHFATFGALGCAESAVNYVPLIIGA